MSYSGPTRTQTKATIFSAVNTGASTFDSDVASGATILVAVTESSATQKYMTCSDDKSNTYQTTFASSEMRSQQSGRTTHFFYATGVASGSTTVTVNVYSDAGRTTSTNANFHVCILEITAAEIDRYVGHANSTSVSSFPLAPSGEIDTVANVYVLGVAAFNASPTAVSAASGFSVLSSSTVTTFYAVVDETSESAETDERGTLSLTTARLGAAFLASFKATASTVRHVSQGNMSAGMQSMGMVL